MIHKARPTLNIPRVTGERSSAERVRTIRTICGMLENVVNAPAISPIKGASNAVTATRFARAFGVAPRRAGS